MKHLKASLGAIVLTICLVFAGSSLAFADDYGVRVPSKIVAGHTFTLTCEGTGIGNNSLYNGRTEIIPSMWMMDTSNAVYGDIFIPIDDYEFISPQQSAVRVSMPGHWTVDATFHPATYTSIQYVGFWDENINVSYNVHKRINVLGTVKFKAGKGKLAAAKKQKTISQRSHVGKLPHPTRQGHAFRGWYTKKSGGTRITSKTVVRFTGATKTYYAHWR